MTDDIQIACKTCRHADVVKDQFGKLDFNHRTCKRYPPVPVLLPAMNAQGQQVGVQLSSAFPTLKASDHCGEWATRGVVLAAGGDAA